MLVFLHPETFSLWRMNKKIGFSHDIENRIIFKLLILKRWNNYFFYTNILAYGNSKKSSYSTLKWSNPICCVMIKARFCQELWVIHLWTRHTHLSRRRNLKTSSEFAIAWLLVNIRHRTKSCGVDFRILIELERLFTHNSYYPSNYHSSCEPLVGQLLNSESESLKGR